MLQANLEYLAYAVGTNEKPFLVLDKQFFEDIAKKDYTLCGFDGRQRKWSSFLKYLKPLNIE